MPKVIEVRVDAARSFNSPHDNYASFQPAVTLILHIGEGEDIDAAVKEAQARAERLVEEHKEATLRSLQELRQLKAQQQEAANLGQQIRNAQARLQQICERNPELAAAVALAGPRHSEEDEDDYQEPQF